MRDRKGKKQKKANHALVEGPTSSTRLNLGGADGERGQLKI